MCINGSMAASRLTCMDMWLGYRYRDVYINVLSFVVENKYVFLLMV